MCTGAYTEIAADAAAPGGAKILQAELFVTIYIKTQEDSNGEERADDSRNYGTGLYDR